MQKAKGYVYRKYLLSKQEIPLVPCGAPKKVVSVANEQVMYYLIIDNNQTIQHVDIFRWRRTFKAGIPYRNIVFNPS